MTLYKNGHKFYLNLDKIHDFMSTGNEEWMSPEGLALRRKSLRDLLGFKGACGRSYPPHSL